MKKVSGAVAATVLIVAALAVYQAVVHRAGSGQGPPAPCYPAPADTVEPNGGAPGATPGGTAPDAPADAAQQWPQWRGPWATGVAPHADPPIHWSDSENIRWKTALPGKGHSTPIVWGDRVFVTSAVPYGEALPPQFSEMPGEHDNAPTTHHHEFRVLALDRSDGSILWQRTLYRELPREAGHVSASLASQSPVTDGEHLYVSFGSRGLYCLDFDGELVWEIQPGDYFSKHGHGEGTSPVLHGDSLVLIWDHEGPSWITAYDKRNGEPRWQVERDEPTSWATPIIVEHAGLVQVVVSGTQRIRGYDLADGRVIWECAGLSSNVVASPVYADGMVYAGNSYNTRVMMAIDLEGAEGDISGSQHVVWSRRRGAPYVPSPLLYDDALYFLNHYQNVLTRVRARSGDEAPGALRLTGLRSLYASPVGAAGRVYFSDLEGATLVIQHADDPEVLALNQLDDSFSASAAIAGRELFLRGERFLYCIAED